MTQLLIVMRKIPWAVVLFIVGMVIFPRFLVKTEAAQPTRAEAVYNPPAPESAPANISDAVMLGYQILKETKKYAEPYVGNTLYPCPFPGPPEYFPA